MIKKFMVYGLWFMVFFRKKQALLMVVIGLFLLLLLLPITYYLLPTPTYAQASSCGGGSPVRAEGLVTSPSLTGKFGTSGKCVIDIKSTFAPFKIPTYADLKSIYYDQSKFPTKSTITTFTGLTVPAGGSLYKVGGDLTVSSNPLGTGVAVVFVAGNLTFSSNYTYGSATSGTIFVVSGNIYIPAAVTQINAVLASDGYIYTAASSGSSCSKNSVVSSALLINGSLISLEGSKPIQFCRVISGVNPPAAEVINHQPKYLVLLRNMFSDSIQKWSEVAGDAPIPTSAPVTAPYPPTNVVASATTSSATVSWTAPFFDGGSSITSYIVVPYIGSTAQASTIVGNVLTTTVGGTTGQTYTYKIKAVNAIGSSVESAASNAVTFAPIYVDNDLDTYGAGAAVLPCPAGKTCVTNNTDCDDSITNIYQNISSLIKDTDQDAYSVGAAAAQCVGTTTVVSSRTYYKDSVGTYTWLPSSSSLGTDCYDANANAKPGQTLYFTTNRDDGSFDYNCSGGTIQTNPTTKCSSTQQLGLHNEPTCNALSWMQRNLCSTQSTVVADCGQKIITDSGTSLYQESFDVCSFVGTETGSSTIVGCH